MTDDTPLVSNKHFHAYPPTYVPALEAQLAALTAERDALAALLMEARDFLREFANDIDDEQAWNMTKRGTEARKIQARIDAASGRRG